jgi:hypothetical protein
VNVQERGRHTLSFSRSLWPVRAQLPEQKQRFALELFVSLVTFIDSFGECASPVDDDKSTPETRDALQTASRCLFLFAMTKPGLGLWLIGAQRQAVSLMV